MTRGCVATIPDQNAQHNQPQVRPGAQKNVVFDIQREKEALLDGRLEFINKNQESKSTPTLPRRPIRDMPAIFNQLFRKKPTRNVRKLKQFFKIFLSQIMIKTLSWN